MDCMEDSYFVRILERQHLKIDRTDQNYNHSTYTARVVIGQTDTKEAKVNGTLKGPGCFIPPPRPKKGTSRKTQMTRTPKGHTTLT